MKSENYIFLPGLHKQLEILFKNIEENQKQILVIGANSESIAEALQIKYDSDVIIIVDENESLLKSRLLLKNINRVSVRMMDFDNTDFSQEKFDLVYAQASVSGKNRNKNLKEIKKILKPGGILCVGEITKLAADEPKFIADIWEASSLLPLKSSELKNNYLNKNFSLIHSEDLSFTLREFYLYSSRLLNEQKDSLSENEKSYYKTILKKISHESNVYLKLGGDKYIGFEVLILKKEA